MLSFSTDYSRGQSILVSLSDTLVTGGDRNGVARQLSINCARELAGEACKQVHDEGIGYVPRFHRIGTAYVKQLTRNYMGLLQAKAHVNVSQ